MIGLGKTVAIFDPCGNAVMKAVVERSRREVELGFFYLVRLKPKYAPPIPCPLPSFWVHENFVCEHYQFAEKAGEFARGLIVDLRA